MLSKLREMREAKGFSRRQLSELSGVSERTIQYAEDGRSDVRLTTALALADALKVTLPDLVGEVEVTPRPEKRSALRVAADELGVSTQRLSQVLRSLSEEAS